MVNTTPVVKTHLARDEARVAQIMGLILRLSVVASVLALVVFYLSSLVFPNLPIYSLVATDALFFLGTLLALFFLRLGRQLLSILVYFVGLLGGTLGILLLTGGVQGPVVMVLLAFPVIAAIFGQRAVAGWMVVIVVGLYLLLAWLEALGVIRPGHLAGGAEQVVRHVLFVVTLILVTYAVAHVSSGLQQALAALQERNQELTAAQGRLEEAAAVARDTAQREEAIAARLRRAVRHYAAFLQRVAAGDDRAELDLARVVPGGLDESDEISADLLMLGQQLTDTVHTLMSTLADLRTMQRRYVQSEWQTLGRARHSFGLRGDRIEPDPGAWTPAMAAAVKGGVATAQDQELALPVLQRGQVIGVIGARRSDDQSWTASDLVLAEAIVDQLAQTMEGLRLLDETQRRAARDRVLAQAASRMHESLDLTAVLQAAAQEMRQAMGLDRVVVRLAQLPEGVEDSASQGGNGHA